MIESGDYISRKAICLTDFEIAMCNGDYKELCKMILDKIANAPAADVQPVVRCCDCKHFQINVSPSGYLPQGVPEWECRNWCGPTDPTGFCSYGVKREES